jgi:hypothetical protein
MVRCRRVFLGTALFLVAGGCAGDPDPLAFSDRPVGQFSLPIVGGEPAAAGEYPSTVALIETHSHEVFCSGTLVSPKVVVTAAHCLDWTPRQSLRVVYGYSTPALAPTTAWLSVSKAVAHPNYDPYVRVDSDGLGATNDIAVVVLQAPIANAQVAPILPPGWVDLELPDWTPTAHRDVHIAGYGISNVWTEHSGVLYKAVTPHIRHTLTEMLAGKPGLPDTCNGDSGGPAYLLRGCGLWLVGVTSRAWIRSDSDCGDGGIYTIASQYMGWIESVSGEGLMRPDPDAGGLDGGVCAEGGSATDGPDDPSVADSDQDGSTDDRLDAPAETLSHQDSDAIAEWSETGGGGASGDAAQAGRDGSALDGSIDALDSAGSAGSGHAADSATGMPPVDDDLKIGGGACACSVIEESRRGARLDRLAAASLLSLLWVGRRTRAAGRRRRAGWQEGAALWERRPILASSPRRGED